MSDCSGDTFTLSSLFDLKGVDQLVSQFGFNAVVQQDTEDYDLEDEDEDVQMDEGDDEQDDDQMDLEEEDEGGGTLEEDVVRMQQKMRQWQQEQQEQDDECDGNDDDDNVADYGADDEVDADDEPVDGYGSRLWEGLVVSTNPTKPSLYTIHWLDTDSNGTTFVTDVNDRATAQSIRNWNRPVIKSKLSEIVKLGDVILVTWEGDETYECLVVGKMANSKNLEVAVCSNTTPEQFPGRENISLKLDEWCYPPSVEAALLSQIDSSSLVRSSSTSSNASQGESDRDLYKRKYANPSKGYEPNVEIYKPAPEVEIEDIKPLAPPRSKLPVISDVDNHSGNIWFSREEDEAIIAGRKEWPKTRDKWREKTHEKYKAIFYPQRRTFNSISQRYSELKRHAELSYILNSTRAFLHFAIKDARMMRRREMKKFNVAKARQALLYKKTGKDKKWAQLQAERGEELEVDPEMSWRAAKGHDVLASKSKDSKGCGFDYVCLTKLFPEEIESYERWKTSRQEQKSSEMDAERVERFNTATVAQLQEEEELEATLNLDEDGDLAEAQNEDDEFEESQFQASHTGQRILRFDLRTDEMEDDWYQKFTEEFRRGSFVSRGKNTVFRQSAKKEKAKGHVKDVKTWANTKSGIARFLYWVGFDPNSSLPLPDDDTTEALAFLAHDCLGRIVEKQSAKKEKAKGHVKDVKTWANTKSGIARFLYWVGFDPNSSLPLPDDDTTEALAFLAHDCLGRIVEKSISLMFQEEIDKGNPILELRGGMQLQPEHIAKALQSQALAAGLFGSRAGGADRTPAQLSKVLASLPRDGLTSSSAVRADLSLDDAAKLAQAQTQHASALIKLNASAGSTLYFGPGCEHRMEVELEELDPAPEKSFVSSTQIAKERLELREEDEIFSKIDKPVGFLKPGTEEFDFFNQKEDVERVKRIEMQLVRLKDTVKPWQMRKYVRIICNDELMNKTGEKIRDGKDKLLVAITGKMFKLDDDKLMWYEEEVRLLTARTKPSEERSDDLNILLRSS
ncbi:hypothetical protein TL16_g11462 [Triparma laevis f. inornata]|uniref:Uncharacterized protein n=1 Tax=Triparma laevis f. inornata TaxID=1714386 RepID=A0A9W7BLT8_9STRA|nr:hypothetical protein TL16_g11462 [Triparma laevis f. inornata]